MCLDIVVNDNEKQVREFCEDNLPKISYNGKWWFVGWKYAASRQYVDQRKDKQNKFCELWDGFHHYDIPLKARRRIYVSDNPKDYKKMKYYVTGFHIFSKRKYVKNYASHHNCTHQVLFRSPYVLGQQCDDTVIVARHVIILSKGNEYEQYTHSKRSRSKTGKAS